MVKVRWSKQAIEDIHRIQEYYSDFAVNFSIQLVDQIFEKENLIANHPEIGRVVPELNNRSVREIIFRNFRIIYAIFDSERISILTVHESSRPLSNISIFD
ncbi:type II toxin-antitoxin system RelE/ParE family toxin [Algoriphagus sp. AK58]|uniref:type II toxin-antitoxin system RelE/ParE family toxin n=1 Tax=Algoriphagus sp. AK58 TaxID=1406877 RepID=UPI0016509631|nr:type II toxin-antitoxin system RelE/ParE family toxin [Algoriphagus sp. AK58]MBC6368435.1 type II toxin-antitoxin system RelE/ParE family toxin [Algoriphagus sp. AK58]